MAQQGKWLKGAQPTAPVSSAAERAVESRLATVEKLLRLAAHRDASNTAVHQLRVATRRAGATLKAYDSLLPPRRARWMRRQLRRVRRAAGETREYDVLLAWLESRLAASADPAWSKLVARVETLRHAAHGPLVKIQSRLAHKHLSRRVRQLVARVAWRAADAPEPTHQAYARERLQSVAASFFAAASGALESIEQLHDFRLHGKQFRYAIEIFAEPLGPALRAEVYPLVEQLQERLGAINDHAQSIERYASWRATWQDPELEVLLGSLETDARQALSASAREFGAWWTPERRDDLQQRFEHALQDTLTEHVA